MIALSVGGLLGGAVVTETVFGLDGMGLRFVNALNSGDPYPVMAWLMVIATIVVACNVVADVVYGLLDSRASWLSALTPFGTR